MLKKRYIIMLSLLILLLFGAKLIFGDEYIGFIVEGTARTGLFRKVNYVVSIDPDIDVNMYMDSNPKMGFALEWDYVNGAELELTLYEIIEERTFWFDERKKIPRELWHVRGNYEKGEIDVQPGDKYEFVITAKNGDAEYDLKVFRPGSVFSSDETDRSNQSGNLVFYRIPKGEQDKTMYCLHTIRTKCSDLR